MTTGTNRADGSQLFAQTAINWRVRAALLMEPGPVEDHPLQIVELADPEPGPDEIVIEVSACGVCRTDLQLVGGDLSPRLVPVIPGHQAVGRVVAAGEQVEGWNVGDRAGVAWLASTCGKCRFCIRGDENLCELAQFTGWNRHGGFSTRLNAAADFAHHLPSDADDLELAPLLCGGVIGYRALKVAGIHPGGRLGLFGFGASALLAIQVARYWDCEVYVVTRSEPERTRALEMGAAWAGPYEEATPVPLDAAITFAPVGDVVIAALRSLDRGGIVAINAIHLDRIPEFDYDLLWLERQIRSVANFTRADAREFLQLASEIPIRTVVDPFPLDRVNEALVALKEGSVNGTAVLTLPSPH